MYETNIVLAKSAKINWGMGHKSLKTIYVGEILRLLTYDAPVWNRVRKKKNIKIRSQEHKG